MAIIVNGQEKYDIRPLLEKGCDINIIHGGRDIGKSYQIKNLVLQDAFENSENGFGYIRRYADDIESPTDIEEYFGNKDSRKLISKITHRKYHCVLARNKTLYFGSSKEVNGEMRKSFGAVLGKAFGLSRSQKNKSKEYDIKNLVYEEFQDEDGKYLIDEPKKLLSLYSTIKRDRTDVKLFLISNTTVQYNPYIEAWGLHNFKNQKKGTIETYDLGNFRIAVERCKEKAEGHSFINNQGIDVMSQDDWKIENYPTYRLTNEEVIYTVVVEVDNFCFLCRLFKYKKGMFLWHVQNKTTDIKEGTRVVGNRFRYDNLYTAKLTGLNQREDVILKMLRDDSKVVYSDRLTGTNFNMLKKYFV